GYHLGDVYRTREIKNYDDNFNPRPEIIETEDPNDVFMGTHDRKAGYVSLQDEWEFRPDWNLITGVRYDHYSDFGSTVNPRIALVWATTPQVTSKLLYGRAFRAPAFAELYSSNPYFEGNPALAPETLDSYELAIN